MFKSGLWETEVLEFDKFSMVRLPVKVKYIICCEIFDIGLFKFDGK